MQTVTNGLDTGDATARNISVIDLTQSNTNNGDGPHDGDAAGIAALSGIGIGVALIYQGNSALVFHDANSALANTGDNAQFSGPQINITGQLALAGAQGGGALALALLGAGALGGDAEAGAANTATSSSLQTVANDMLTGVAMAVNGIGVTASQANTNTGDAAGLVLAVVPALAASAIVQDNHLSVTQEGNSAVANSGLNSQSAGGQLNATVQIAADESEAGASGAGAIIGAVAVDGDPTASSVNDATSQNTTDASNTMATGNATRDEPAPGRRHPGERQRRRRDRRRSLTPLGPSGEGRPAPPPNPGLSTRRRRVIPHTSRDLAAPGREQAFTAMKTNRDHPLSHADSS